MERIKTLSKDYAAFLAHTPTPKKKKKFYKKAFKIRLKMKIILKIVMQNFIILVTL